MGIDQEAIRKRFSQLEMDINNMNKMIDENLQINETQPEKAVQEEQKEPMKREVQGEHETVDPGVLSPKKFSEITALAAQDFISTAGAKEPEEEQKSNNPAEQKKEDTMEREMVEPVEQTIPEAVEQKIEGPVAKKIEVAEPVKEPPSEPVASLKKSVSPTTVAAEPAPVLETTPQPSHVDTTGDTTDYAIDRTTDTSEDFTAVNVTAATSSHSSLSSPVEPVTPIFIPKNNGASNAASGPATASLRRPTNPFRVVSVGAPHSDGSGTRKPSDEAKVTDSDSVTKLQKRLDYLTKKCLKLQREIKYLHDMNYKNTLSIEDGRKLSSAIDKLQEYLDRKTKEKYDLGVLVSRQLRKEIDRGENGQFWIGTK